MSTHEFNIVLRNPESGDLLTIYIDVFETSLSRKWFDALNFILANNNHLEKNFCFHGFVSSGRSQPYLVDQINASIAAINKGNLGYIIDDHFTLENTIDANGQLIHDKLNDLHRYFEDLQGVQGSLSPFYEKADPNLRWHIRQLNLLCHEYESSVKCSKQFTVDPNKYRPSQLMCWLEAPRFNLTPEDCESFGIETLTRSFGGVYVGVNKAVGKTHWEVFMDEGNKLLDELTTTVLRPQTVAAGDFDIEWGSQVGKDEWQRKQFAEFESWLKLNGFDPQDKSLTLGHPKVAQVNLLKSFGTEDGIAIRKKLGQYLDVYQINTNTNSQTYNYKWSDLDYQEQQVRILHANP